MGNQTSRVIEKTKERRANRTRRRSTATVGARSQSSLSVSHAESTYSQGNYDWIDPNSVPSASGSAAIESAMAAAVAAATAAAAAASSSSSSTTNAAISRPPTVSDSPAISTSSDTTSPSPQPTVSVSRAAVPRRKSISEVFMKRKGSFSRNNVSEQDFREYDRLQRQHYLLKSARKSNVWAPIDQPSVIVDIGTANGIWALEMAATYINSKVIGIDIKPPLMQQGGPKNLEFKAGNVNESLPLEDGTVDLLFQRSMGQIIRKDKWPHVLSEMYRVLKPGGYIELLEADLWHHNPGPVQQALDTFMQEQCAEWGLDFVFTESLSSWIEQAGFVDLKQRTLDIPIGEWPRDPELKQFGFINKETQKAFLRNRKNFYVSAWGISSEDYDLAVQEVMEEFEEYHGFTRFNCWIARKP